MNSRLPYSLLLSLLVTALTSCHRGGNAPGAGEHVLAVPVRITVLAPSPLVDAIDVAGTVKAIEDASISAEEGGVVKEWKVTKGQRVSRGSILVLLKDDVVKASVDAADAQYRLAALNLEKQQKVFEEKGISELQFKTLVYMRDAAKANADLMKARWEHTRITSPIDGIVDNTIPNVGELAAPGIPLARVVNTSAIKLQAEIPEHYAGDRLLGARLAATFDALPGDTVRGRLSFVSSTVASANRSILVEARIPNPAGKLRPDMIATVTIFRDANPKALLISENIVQLVDRDRQIVYVENAGKAEERRVSLGGRQGSLVEIREGLRAGDRLIVAGYQRLVNGQPVIVSE
jgi:membrane fusion protein (multidrug efflux system)